MEGLWRNVEMENLSHLVLWFLQWSTFLSACYMRQCRKLYVALGLDSAVCYPFMLRGQGSCLLCTLVQLVALLTSLPPFVWPVGTTILGVAENYWGVLSHPQVSEAVAIRLLTGGFYQAAFLFHGMFFHPPHFHSACSTLCSLSVMKRRLSLWIGKFCLKYSSCFSLQLLRSLLNSVLLVALLISSCLAATPTPLLCMKELAL